MPQNPQKAIKKFHTFNKMLILSKMWAERACAKGWFYDFTVDGMLRPGSNRTQFPIFSSAIAS